MQDSDGTLVINALETRRFGMVCARIDGLAAALPDLDAANRAAAAQGVAMISTRVDVGDLARVHALEADGYRLMDTLVYWARPLTDLPAPRPLPEGVTLGLAAPEHAPAVAEVARAAFKGYFGHYHADPRLDSAAADAAYVEWAETSAAKAGAEAPVLLAWKGDKIFGFIASSKVDAGEVEIVLNAVHPNMQRGGIYSAMVAGSMKILADLGASRVEVSTQINNYAVQRAWARLGFAHFKGLYTFHKWLAPADA